MADFRARDKNPEDIDTTQDADQPASNNFRPLSRQRRDTLFGVLEDRIHDVNSFARSHVLKCYKDLCEEGAVPLRHIQKLPAIAVERMQDRTGGVRKYSIELLCTLLEHNPFRENLDREYYEHQKANLMEKFTAKKQEVMKDVEEQLNRRLSGLNVNESQVAEEEGENEVELQKIERLLLFHTQALEFIEIVEEQAIPLLVQLLGSAAVTDVLEAIRFFHKAHGFRLNKATVGIRAMLILVWPSSVKEARHKSQKDKNDVEKPSSMEEELGMNAEIEAEEDEFLHSLTHELVGRWDLPGAYGPILIRLVANEEGIFDDDLIKEASTVALCKFMCISGDFCDKNLPLIFTKLKECQQPSVRSNIVVALGDLSFRFPNLVEPWTSHIYARLRDIDVNVRKNTIMVLTHLILNDMVKVKGQISEIALSLVDEDKRICDLAKLFFHELSKRGNNPIYNMLPDTIGRLSTSSNLSKKSFQEITKFLLGFIQKDKQAESLVEKLCQRFVTTAEVTQWRDFAYCLSNLPFNDRALKKLIELRKMFKTCLVDDGVYESFQQIISKAKKFCKAEMKESLDEIERMIEVMHSGENVDDTETFADLPTKKADKQKTPRKQRKEKENSQDKPQTENVEDDEDAMPKKLERKSRKAKKPTRVEESEDEPISEVAEDSDMEEEPVRAQKGKGEKRKKAEAPRAKSKQSKKKQKDL
ncbi:unnamed protein product [Aphanomyces euteiches]